MRIVSLAPSNTEILYALGVEEQIVAVTKFCDWPAQVIDKPRIGSWPHINPERVRQLSPDLILTSWMPPELVEWSGPGNVLHVEPKNLWDVFENVRTIGEAVGAGSAADRIVRQMEQGFDVLRTWSPARQPRVYMEEWYDPPVVAGNWIPELVAIAGGQAVLTEINQPSKPFSLAALTVADPDLVVCHWSGWGHRTDESRILQRPGWEEVRAVREGRVWFIDDALINRPGPRLVQGANELQRVLQEWSMN